MTVVLKVLAILFLLSGCLTFFFQTSGINAELGYWLSGHHLMRFVGGAVLLVIGGALLSHTVGRDVEGR